MLIKLTKRNYLGAGYYNIFQSNTTNERIIEECTQAEYQALALPNPTNPIKDGYTFTGALGNTIKVDNPSGMLNPNEYCDMEDKYGICLFDNLQSPLTFTVTKDKIVNDQIETDNIKDIWL